jgi:hypothetical protein
MADPLKPPVSLLAKVGSICQHVDEGMSANGHAFDLVAVKALLADSEVSAWLDAVHKLALLPVRRKP